MQDTWKQPQPNEVAEVLDGSEMSLPRTCLSHTKQQQVSAVRTEGFKREELGGIFTTLRTFSKLY